MLIKLRELFDYDGKTGVLVWRVGTGGRHVGDMAGTKDRAGYVRVQARGRLWLAHRLVWAYVHGEWPRGQIDHINGDRADNRIANLRDVSPSVNRQNMRAATRMNKTGFLGVHIQDGRYKAAITIDGKRTGLGSFGTGEEAHAAYLAKKRLHHQGCTL